MAAIILILIFFALCFATVPIGIAMGTGVLGYVMAVGQPSLSYIAANMFTACDSFPLLAIPFFTLSGSLMEGGGLSKRLVDFFDTLVGHLPGGLAICTVITCMFFGAISGSAPATVAAVGSIMVPTMVVKGYDKKFAMALAAAAGCLGTIIPPSIPMVMYGVSTGESIADMFAGGFLPGVICGLMLIVVAVHISRKEGFGSNGMKFSIARVGRQFVKSIGALLVPVIILGGIYGGIFTPTEAAVVSVIYAYIVGKFGYKELTWEVTWTRFASASKTIGSVMIIVASGTILGRILTIANIPQMVSAGLLGVTDNMYVMLLLMNLILLVVGCLMETTSAILILAPIFLPVVESLGVDPIHFGIIMVVNLSIGFITPPVGANLFVACGLGDISFVALVKKIVPFLIALLVGMVLITYIPSISTLLPGLMNS